MQDMLTNPTAALILAHADDKLMLGHVQSDWTGLGPILEEDIASSAMAQDDLSHALTLYEYLGNTYGLDPDVIAFERDPADYMCCDLVTQSDEFDWANSVVKRWLMAVFTRIAIERLSNREDADLTENFKTFILSFKSIKAYSPERLIRTVRWPNGNERSIHKSAFVLVASTTILTTLARMFITTLFLKCWATGLLVIISRKRFALGLGNC